MRVGYARVSTADQNPDRQREGLSVEKAFLDAVSGRDDQRPQLEAMLNFVRESDVIQVHSMDRLARNLDDLRRLVSQLTKRGIQIEFVKERLVFNGDDPPMANRMLSVMGAFAEFERALIKGRQREGIALAKTKGVYRGRKRPLTPAQAAQLRARAVVAGVCKAALAREYGVSRQTLYVCPKG